MSDKSEEVSTRLVNGCVSVCEKQFIECGWDSVYRGKYASKWRHGVYGDYTIVNEYSDVIMDAWLIGYSAGRL